MILGMRGLSSGACCECDVIALQGIAYMRKRTEVPPDSSTYVERGDERMSIVGYA